MSNSLSNNSESVINSRKCAYYGSHYNNNKLAPYGTDGRLLLTAKFSHVTQKSGPDKLWVLCPNLKGGGESL